MKKSEYMQDWEKFRNFFWKSLNLDDYVEILPNGELTFDIFKFECFLIWHWYDENESMKDYISREFWTIASEFIEHLLD